MIVRMSKIEIIGPKESLMEVLSLIQKRGVLQINGEIKGAVNERVEPHLRSLLMDGKTLSERLFFEDLKVKIDNLLAYLPQVSAKESYLNPPTAINSIASLVPKHTTSCRDISKKKEAAQKELIELNRYAAFLSTVEALLHGVTEDTGLDFIGIEVRDPAALEHLTRIAGHLLLGAEVQTAKTEEGTYIGLLTTEKELSEQLKTALSDNQIPEVSLPPYLEDLPFPEKIKAAQRRRDDLSAEISGADHELQSFAYRWLDLYRKVRAWLEDRLALLKTTASLYETETCFFLFGWLPSADLKKLREILAEKFHDTVVVEEKEILEQDQERVPVVLKNPLYFQPFELLIRLLPLPRYTSYDATPFIGIFFPLFFGMTLGDIGYGIILFLVALALIYLVKHKKNVVDAGKILGVAALYTIFFGWLFGECFGEFGSEVLGLEPICFDRRTAIIPMLYFSMAVGMVHITLGLVLGALSALKRKMRKEALFKLLSVLVILCAVAFSATFLAPVPSLIRKPLLMTILIISPILLVTGGLLGPLELLKNFGNIISYARIMAIGLTSVLLAYVANHLAGSAGSIWVGIFVAVLLHTFNIILGVFAPTIHSLRLHYVEFFGKFMEPGGKQFKPLKKDK